MKLTRILTVLAVALPLLAPSGARAEAIEIGGGVVTRLEATYMPGGFNFSITSGDKDGRCPPGRWLQYEDGNAEKVKAAYATILAAYLSGRPVYAFYDLADVNGGSCATFKDPTQCCLVRFIGVQ
jgi:hypothetical protein